VGSDNKGRSDLGFMIGADFPPPRKETAAAKAQRLAREAEMIAKARASVAAGQAITYLVRPGKSPSQLAD
jgi:hypothetical protein